MALPTSLWEREKEINDELKSSKLRACIKIIKFDEKTRAIEYNVGFFEMPPNEVVFPTR